MRKTSQDAPRSQLICSFLRDNYCLVSHFWREGINHQQKSVDANKEMDVLSGTLQYHSISFLLESHDFIKRMATGFLAPD